MQGARDDLMKNTNTVTQVLDRVRDIRLKHIWYELESLYKSVEDLDPIWRAYANTTPINMNALLATLASGCASSVFFAPPSNNVLGSIFLVMTLVSGYILWFRFHLVSETKLQKDIRRCREFAFKYELTTISNLKHFMYMICDLLGSTKNAYEAKMFHQKLNMIYLATMKLYRNNIDLDIEADEEDKQLADDQ